MIEITKVIDKRDDSMFTRAFSYLVKVTFTDGSVNFRTGRCWHPDNRYPGDWAVRRHESGGVEITFGGTTHRSRPIVKVIDQKDVDGLILSLLECRGDD
jgi:hypothetical protein